VQILAALRLAVARPDLVEQIAHLQAGAGPTAAVLFRRIVLRARAQRRLAAIFPRSFPEHFSGPLGILQFQANLREQTDQQLVDVVIDPDGCFDELAVVRRRHGFALCNGGIDKNTAHLENLTTRALFRKCDKMCEYEGRHDFISIG